VMVYINTSVLFQSLQKLADKTTRASMERNREYIVSFRQVGFQLIPEAGGFKTVIAEKYSPPEQQAAIVETAEPLQAAIGLPKTPSSVDPAEEEEPAIDSDPMALPYIYVTDLNKPSFRSYFPDLPATAQGDNEPTAGSTIHFEVELKNGFKDGAFTEYYGNGQVKMKGHFKNDKRDGAWRLFDKEGELILRRTYESGVVRKERVKD
jgi:hypothetical protein